MKLFFTLFFGQIFVNNIALTYFLGMCPFVSLSKSLKTAFGMGVAVTLVMTITAAINWPLYHYLLSPTTGYNLPFLQYLFFILVIAASVQVTEVLLDRFSPVLYTSFGIFLPLITVNCAILGVSLFIIIRNYNFLETIAFSLGSGIGWLVAIMAMSGIRTRLKFANVPVALEGAGITLIISGLLAFAFMGFAGW
ncbi:MAG: Rnf-Nqr domain containing protein [Pseudomonadota bacterium]